MLLHVVDSCPGKMDLADKLIKNHPCGSLAAQSGVCGILRKYTLYRRPGPEGGGVCRASRSQVWAWERELASPRNWVGSRVWAPPQTWAA